MKILLSKDKSITRTKSNASMSTKEDVTSQINIEEDKEMETTTAMYTEKLANQNFTEKKRSRKRRRK